MKLRMTSKKQTTIRAVFLLLLPVLCFFTTDSFVLAQGTSEAVKARRAQLEEDLVELEARIEEQRVILQGKQRETVSLERDIAILDARIQSSELSIKARDLTIRKLGTEIGGKEELIDTLSQKLEREKQSLAQLLRKTREMDSY